MTSVFAPGRVELLGNHTDYNAGVVLSAALDLGITASGMVRPDSTISLSSEGFDPVVVDPGDEPVARGDWTDYAVGVAKVLRDAGYPVRGFEAAYASTLPTGAGLSSSAAMEISTLVLLMRLFDLQLDAMQVARLGRKAENEFVGVNCGLLDQVSSVFGRRDHVVFLDCRSESVERIPFPPGFSLLIVDSGAKHELTGGEYNERREQCFQAAAAMQIPALRDASPAMLGAATLPDVVRRRAAHVIGENERVFSALDALRARDAARFGRLMSESHQSSIHNFENSTPELDLLVSLLIDQKGVHGARLTGGGFGGAVVALVDSEAIDVVMVETLESYRVASGIETRAFECALGDGAIFEV